jgi:hypothetical protein
MERIEHSARLQMWLPASPITNEEREILKIADMLEMMEKGLQECMLGNRFAELVVHRTHSWLIETIASMPPGSLRSNLDTYMRRRLREWPPAFTLPPLPTTREVVRYQNEFPFGFSVSEEI